MMLAKIGKTESIIQNRDLAVTLFIEGMTKIAEASELAELNLFSYNIKSNLQFSYSAESVDLSKEKGRKLIDAHVWLKLFKITQLDDLWNSNEFKRFNESIKENPPIPTIQSIHDILSSAYESRAKTLANGLICTLSQLDRKFQNNNKSFSFPTKIIFSHAFAAWPGSGWDPYKDSDRHLRDLEKVICIVCGDPIPHRNDSVVLKVLSMRNSSNEGAFDVKDKHIQIRVFKNGNLHLIVHNSETLLALNRLIECVYGNNLPHCE